MNKFLIQLIIGSVIAFTVVHMMNPTVLYASADAHAEEEEIEKGPHRGRMLRDGEFAIELSIFETGMPPEFRVWVTHAGNPVSPGEVNLNIKLVRLGDGTDDINFNPQDDFLRGDMEIYEPHSFEVVISATYQGKTYHWRYDNYEGRTQIADETARAMAVTTDIVGQQTLTQTMKVFGKLILPNESSREISARFDGVIKKSMVAIGDQVKQGQALYVIESNESLQPYTISSPIAGVVTEKYKHTGEQTMGQPLLSIENHSAMIAELALFPKQLARLGSKSLLGINTSITFTDSAQEVNAKIGRVLPSITPDQARLVWVEIDNPDGLIAPGSFVTAELDIDTFEVPMAVKRSGLQGFRDFTVVYAKFGDQYEVRMLELGRIGGEWIEVISGIKAGTEYVSGNSYIIKADIEKSGAAHDH